MLHVPVKRQLGHVYLEVEVAAQPVFHQLLSVDRIAEPKCGGQVLCLAIRQHFRRPRQGRAEPLSATKVRGKDRSVASNEPIFPGQLVQVTERPDPFRRKLLNGVVVHGRCVSPDGLGKCSGDSF